MPATNNPLPANVRSGHVAKGRIALPGGFTIDCRAGQLVDVRCPAGHRYLLSETRTHWLLHRRITPAAPGHARNHVEPGPPLGIEKCDGDE